MKRSFATWAGHDPRPLVDPPDPPDRQGPPAPTLPVELAALRYLLEHTRRQLADALARLNAAEARDSQAALYGRVGLHRDCPDFVLKAVRRAYRRHLHPDANAPAVRAESERRFKAAESLFDRIAATRA